LFVFLYHKDVPFDNNHAEHTIRGVVVMRKNSDCNRSKVEAKTQAMLMSVFQTLKQRNANVTKISSRSRGNEKRFSSYSLIDQEESQTCCFFPSFPVE